MGGIRDEGQLTDKRFGINSSAGMERGGKPPRPEIIADIYLVGLVARDGGPRCELPDGFPSVQVRAGRVEDHFVTRLRFRLMPRLLAPWSACVKPPSMAFSFHNRSKTDGVESRIVVREITGHEPSPPVWSLRLWRSLLCQPFDEARCRPAQKTGKVVTDPGERSSSDSFIKADEKAGQFLVHPGNCGERHPQLIRGDREVRDASRSRTTDIASAAIRVG